MKRLIILSDLWGEKSDWVSYYTSSLLTQFDIHYYDCRALAAIDLAIKEEAKIHQLFVQGGIERAVEKLLQSESEEVAILAFSVGGAIAWKAIQQGLKVSLFYAVSATRLRYEIATIACPTKLFYGEKDAFRPNVAWLEKMQIPHCIFAGASHICYREKRIAELITTDFIENFNS